MYVGIARFELHIPASASLKAKRTVVKGLIGGLRAKFNVAAAEVDHLELWQRTALGVTCVSGEAWHVQQMLENIEGFVESEHRVDVLSVHTDVVQDED